MNFNRIFYSVQCCFVNLSEWSGSDRELVESVKSIDLCVGVFVYFCVWMVLYMFELFCVYVCMYVCVCMCVVRVCTFLLVSCEIHVEKLSQFQNKVEKVLDREVVTLFVCIREEGDRWVSLCVGHLFMFVCFLFI